MKILVVEDEQQLRDALGEMLRAGFAEVVVLGAVDARSGLKLSVEARPDLILVDISLPDQSGVELTRSILDALPQAKVVVLSEHDSLVCHQAARNAGAATFLHKAKIDGKLMPILRRLLEQQPAGAAQPPDAPLTQS
jgi:DNA-binding NarL/FixJ family response regulator